MTSSELKKVRCPGCGFEYEVHFEHTCERQGVVLGKNLIDPIDLLLHMREALDAIRENTARVTTQAPSEPPADVRADRATLQQAYEQGALLLHHAENLVDSARQAHRDYLASGELMRAYGECILICKRIHTLSGKLLTRLEQGA